MINLAFWHNEETGEVSRKYVFCNNLVDLPSGPTATRSLYDHVDTVKLADNIVSSFDVVAPAVAWVTVSYARNSTFVQEQIFVDISSNEKFWYDIAGWMYTKNLYDITLETDKYYVNDTHNISYLLLQQTP